MPGLIAEVFGTTTDAPANPTIAASTIASAAGSAQAYLAATLEATTPEVRRLFSEYMAQTIIGQEAIQGLAVKKGWANPYDAPEKQLEMSDQAAKSVLT
jgi:spore coat protein CotF